MINGCGFLMEWLGWQYLLQYALAYILHILHGDYGPFCCYQEYIREKKKMTMMRRIALDRY